MQKQSSGDVLDLEVGVEVWLAEERVPLERLLELSPGASFALGKDPDEPVDLLVNGTVIAQGELIIVDGHFGVRVTSTRLGEIDAEALAADEESTAAAGEETSDA